MEDHLFQRSKYSERLRLTAADLENQQAYDSGKRNLLNRVLFGRGIVYGLAVRYDAVRSGILVEPGLAVDAWGHELFVPERAFFPADALFPRRQEGADGWRLCIRYEERECGGGHLLQPDGTHCAVPNRVEEGYRILAVRDPPEDELCLARLSVIFENGAPCIRSLTPAGSALPRRRTAAGVLRISAEAGQHGGEVFYSDEISHGLGAGAVQITLAAEGYERDRLCLISGAEELFRTGLQTAVKLFPDSGTFVAAARVSGGFHGTLTLHWFAQKAEDPSPQREPPAPDVPEQPRDREPLRLEPRVALLRPGEQVRFFVCTPDGTPRALQPRFTAVDGGGSIDENGVYTAPQTPGTYPVKADFADAPANSLSASAMVLERM